LELSVEPRQSEESTKTHRERQERQKSQLEQEGGGGTGGGDANSKRIRAIKAFFAQDAVKIRQDLAHIAANVAKFSPAPGEISAQIVDLFQKGITEDFANAKYTLQAYCADEKGIERSASTLKVDLSKNPNQPRPDICVNMRRMSIENPDYPSIVGLLFHEHARHYGIEDVDSLDLNPIADFVTEHFSELTDKTLNAGESLDGMVVRSLYSWSPLEEVVVESTKESFDGSVVVDEATGNCGGLSAGVLWTPSESSRPYIKRELGELQPGSQISMQVAQSVEKNSDGMHKIGFYLKGNMMDKSPLAAFFGVDRVCHLTFHIERNGKKSRPYVGDLNSNHWEDGRVARHGGQMFLRIQFRYPSELEDLK
jgi:hypothetical protein